MMETIFLILAILIVYPLFIYPLSLMLISYFKKNKDKKVYYEINELPYISYVVVVYNEEKIIKKKLENISKLEYSNEKIEYIIASDDSNDNTHDIVKEYILNHPEINIQLQIIKGRKGKTEVQNQVVKLCKGEVIAFSDANSMWDIKSLLYLIGRFKDKKIGYVSGNLQYFDTEDITAQAESDYWNFDLKIREMESEICSIVGGNGSIYAIRKCCYVDLPPMLSHDGFMPTKMVLSGYKAKNESKAYAYEKASKNPNDEFSRKVRMQRGQPFKKYYDKEKFNIFKYGFFSYFYIGHKYLKYLLYVFHLLIILVNILLFQTNFFYKATMVLQLVFYLFALFGFVKRKQEKPNKLFYFCYHYTMTIIAQVVSIINTFRGKNYVTWEKSETTRS